MRIVILSVGIAVITAITWVCIEFPDFHSSLAIIICGALCIPAIIFIFISAKTQTRIVQEMEKKQLRKDIEEIYGKEFAEKSQEENINKSRKVY